MFSKDLINDASSFKYKIGDKFKLFGVKVEIVNETWTSNYVVKNSEDKLYDVYIKSIDRYSIVSEKLLNKYAESDNN